MSLEFDLIQTFFAQHPASEDLILGIGDDAAIVRVPRDHELVVTTDTLIAGVHFPESVSPGKIAHKALAVNLSDLAAMAAMPRWFTLALTLPDYDPAWLERFSRGLFRLSRQHQTDLIGGDTTKGALSITIQALGVVPNGGGIPRDGARPGDDLYVTGTLGDAALGLMSLQTPVALSGADTDFCQHRLDCPEPRIRAGLALRDHASAMIDCSDGLAADLGHILNAGNVGAEVMLDALPVSGAVKSWLDTSGDWSLPLAGGDDYELIFTAPTERRQDVEALDGDAGCRITRVGMIRSQPGLMFVKPDGASLKLETLGYSHF